MAVPFFIQEDAEDCYRSLDFLLEQLLITLRQVMMLRRREAMSNARTTRFDVECNRQNRHVPVEVRNSENRSSEVLSSSAPTTTITTTNCSDRNVESSRNIVRPVLPLPDVVMDTTSALQEQKESERTRTTRTPTTHLEGTDSMAETQDWVQVGADLKRIADQLLAANRLDQISEQKSEIKSEKETISLLSLFCPPPLGSSVWTTVAILVGWGLLSRTR